MPQCREVSQRLALCVMLGTWLLPSSALGGCSSKKVGFHLEGGKTIRWPSYPALLYQVWHTHVLQCERHVHLARLLRFLAARWIHLSLATGAGALQEIQDSLRGLHAQRNLFAKAGFLPEAKVGGIEYSIELQVQHA